MIHPRAKALRLTELACCRAGLAGLCLWLAGCTPPPQLDAALSRQALGADYPVLLPTADFAATPEATTSLTAQGAALEARAAALRARADTLRAQPL
ncbi:hypothetical protein AQS8620_01360 [Aquimixticola soesokkakensis]|uniref:Uncharacterized protein n=1 Tax=Aquimixticola soesokkakensis TaxID=1519096 RepID=A0A1Y5SD50_9RHOB|nr:hypothetical protein [Aquimixticola soesokkakensis]SLN37301.1 hypothetical protein AQS8620_01360 [Aquimixticola soesokkakensis]